MVNPSADPHGYHMWRNRHALTHNLHTVSSYNIVMRRTKHYWFCVSSLVKFKFKLNKTSMFISPACKNSSKQFPFLVTDWIPRQDVNYNLRTIFLGIVILQVRLHCTWVISESFPFPVQSQTRSLLCIVILLLWVQQLKYSWVDCSWYKTFSAPVCNKISCLKRHLTSIANNWWASFWHSDQILIDAQSTRPIHLNASTFHSCFQLEENRRNSLASMNKALHSIILSLKENKIPPTSSLAT